MVLVPDRLTRDQSQAETRQRLIDAGKRVVAREGLAALSVTGVAAEAGLTTGAVYSNFEGRAGLVFEVSAAVSEEFAAPPSLMPPVDVGAETWLRGIAAVLADHTDNPKAVALATELMSAALRDDSVGVTARAVATRSLEEIADIVREARCEASGFAPEELALVVMALFTGLSQLRTLLGPEAVSMELCARAFGSLSGQAEPVRSRRRRA